MFNNDQIAIIGMGCRFPGGSNSVAEFWNNIKNGRDCVTDIPKDRWDIAEFYHYNEEIPGKSKSKSGGFIDRFDQFDAAFFEMNAREAEQIDPQQRQVLEIVWEAFEQAGLKPAEYAGSNTGVFMGGFTLDYQILQFADPDGIASHTAVGSMMTMLSNRISYVYDFTGPSMSIDTACSSSLVALHQACLSLKNDECRMAVAGGIELVFTPEYYIAESKGGFLSKDGRCKTFDQNANGYVRGEGGGILLLKRLPDAVRDHDHIYAVVRETLVNQDGKTVGITVPNGDMQRKLLEGIYQRSQITPQEVSYVEVHGTGTGVGDPIESNVIADFFGKDRGGDPCVIASVKANIGHLEAASGVASIIKVICSMNEHLIAPHIGMKNLNPQISLTEGIRIPLALEEWPDRGHKRVAGVNSFGFGGTNAHVILEEYIADSKQYDGHKVYSERPDILHISGKSEYSVKELAKQYYDFLEANEIALASICHEVNTKREAMFYGLAVIGRTNEEMRDHLNNYISGQADDEAAVTGTQRNDQRLVFVFTGMGPQWYGMGRELFEQDPVFRDSILQTDKAFSRYMDWSIVDELRAAEPESRIDRTDVAQPMNFAIQVAVSDMLASMGVRPSAIVGHSVGEVSAFYVAGVYSLEEAVRISWHRGRCQNKLTGRGGMLAAGLSEQQAQEYLKDVEASVSIAAINSNSSITLSGDEQSLHIVADKLEEEQIFNRFLKVNIPYHSFYMEEIKEEFLESVGSIHAGKAKVALYTTAAGKHSDGTDLDAEYWWKNIRNPVHFAKAAEGLLAEGYATFIEIGPHPVLARSIKELAEEHEKTIVTLATLERKKVEMLSMHRTLAGLMNQGYPVELSCLYHGDFPEVPLPLYRWDHKRYWKEPLLHSRRRLGLKDHVMLGYRTDSIIEQWDAEINDYIMPFIKDHIIGGQCLIAGAHYIETALQLLKIENNDDYISALELFDLRFVRATYLDKNNCARLSVGYDRRTGAVRIYQKLDDNQYKLSFEAYAKRRQLAAASLTIDIAIQKEGCRQYMDGEQCYRALAESGYHYGPAFQGLNQVWLKEQGVFAGISGIEELHVPDNEAILHPVLLDAAFQCMILCQFGAENNSGVENVKLPVAVDRITVYQKPAGGLYVSGTLTQSDDKKVVADMTLYNLSGRVVAEITGFTAKTLEQDQGRLRLSQNELNNWFYQVVWKETNKTEDEINQGTVKEYDEWIIFSDEEGNGEKLSKCLKKKGKKCRVLYGDYVRDKKDTVALSNPEGWRELWQGLPLAGRYGIIYMCGMDVGFSATSANHTEIITAKNRLINPLRYIVNSLVEANVSGHIWNITRNAQKVQSSDQGINVNQGAVIGMNRVIAQNEGITTWAANIDIDNNRDNWDLMSDDLLHVTSENEVAYRNGKRFTARLEHLKVTDPAIPLMIDQDKVYIVSGGLGSLGIITANWLIQKGATRLVLLGRSDIDKDETKTRSLERLCSNGIRVEYFPVDVMDIHAVKELLHKIRNRGEKIGGIFQIAGVLKDVLFMSMTQEDFDAVFDPKAIGAWNLSQATWEDELDFFVMYSSAGAVVTAVGQANYAAGNAYMDALAEYRRQQGKPAQSIAWGPWAVGMIQQMNLTDYYRDVKGMTPIYDTTGMQALEAVLGQDLPHVVVCGTNWPQALTNYPGKPPLFRHLSHQDEAAGQSSEEIDIIDELALENDEKIQKQLLQEFILNIIADVTFMPKDSLHADWSLSAVGIDSLMATEIRNRINNKCGVTVTIANILGGASIENLNEKLYEQVGSQVMQRREEIEEMLKQLEEQ